MKVLSLFNGVSCWRPAFERAGIEVEKGVNFETDKYANQVAQRNYPNDEYNGDVFQGDSTKYKGFDMLVGGSPCTSWSIAKQGRETTSSGIGWDLFMQYKRALVESECRYFLYENNYSIHKDIKTAITAELGVEPIMINSALVSAQQRKRLYWTNIPGITQPEDRGILLKDILESGISEREKSYCLKHQSGNSRDYFKKHHTQIAFEPVRVGTIENNAKNNKHDSQQYRVYSVYGKSINLCGNGGGTGAKTGLYKIDLPDGDYIIRKLTVKECCRLQTLPDNYFADENGKKIVSDTQAYKCLGNGWTVDIIAHILGFLPRK